MQDYWETTLGRASSLAPRNKAREGTMGREVVGRGNREKEHTQREKGEKERRGAWLFHNVFQAVLIKREPLSVPLCPQQNKIKPRIM